MAIRCHFRNFDFKSRSRPLKAYVCAGVNVRKERQAGRGRAGQGCAVKAPLRLYGEQTVAGQRGVASPKATTPVFRIAVLSTLQGKVVCSDYLECPAVHLSLSSSSSTCGWRCVQCPLWLRASGHSGCAVSGCSEQRLLLSRRDQTEKSQKSNNTYSHA